ncbi:hypothetical protein G7046_g7767 [Stylonectria norvegica]|nr:hypothetical protein G7046_g7767 [Stylonectria norvegica]
MFVPIRVFFAPQMRKPHNNCSILVLSASPGSAGLLRFLIPRSDIRYKAKPEDVARLIPVVLLVSDLDDDGTCVLLPSAAHNLFKPSEAILMNLGPRATRRSRWRSSRTRLETPTLRTERSRCHGGPELRRELAISQLRRLRYLKSIASAGPPGRPQLLLMGAVANKSMSSMSMSMPSQSPTRESPESNANSRVPKLARRPHRKSRYGCFNCKRRKVKCDEVKPSCANCLRFGISCDFAPPPTLPQTTNAPRLLAPLGSDLGGGSQTGIDASASSVPRRGPGRPRKDWSNLPRIPLPSIERSTVSPTLMAATPSVTSSSPLMDYNPCSLNVADAELLLHFVSYTASTLADSGMVDDNITQFWARNVPKMGISHHFVLHLTYALAAYHMAYSDAGDSEQRSRQLSLAEHHSSAGLAELNQVLPQLDETNCGALYVSAVAMCYCTFAAGPTSIDDLLVCDVGEGAHQRWLPLINGVRSIRQTVEPATLFTGLMEPLGRPDRSNNEPYRLIYLREGLPRVDWIEPLDKLRSWITSHPTPDTIIYSRALESLCKIYEATYGNQNGGYDGPPSDSFVFGWLYRMQEPYVACLRRREPLALVILAYYAPLLDTLKKCWFLDGWSEHLLTAIGEILDSGVRGWLHWPVEVSRQTMQAN